MAANPPAPAPGAQAAAAAAAAPATIFALTPGQHSPNVPLDFAKSDDIKLYKAGSKELGLKVTGRPGQLRLLKKTIQDRATEMGWTNSILNVPTSNVQNAPKYNVITHHGQLSYDQLKEHAVNTIINKNTRAAQDNVMMYMSLSSSMTEGCSKHLLPDKAKYEVGGIAIATMFFKTLVGKGEAQTVATTANIRKSLSTLQEHIKTVSYDIVVFHEHVNGLLQDLNGYGQDDVPDLTVHLFDSYSKVPDKIFREMIGKKHNDYLLGSSTIDHEELMNFATTAYNVRKADLSMPWLEKSEEQQQIEALNAELDELKKSQVRNSKKKKPTSKADKISKKGDGKKSDKYKDKWAWKEVPPKEGEPKVKQVNGKTYHWCRYHNAWTIHTEEECNLKDKKPKAKEQEEVEANEASVEDDDDNDSNTGGDDDDDDDVQGVLNSYAAAVASE